MKFQFLLPFVLLIFMACEATSQKSVEKAEANPKSSYANVDVDQFKKLMQTPDVVILDVRTPEETQEGIIEGAVEIDFQDPAFNQKIKELDKDKTYLVYCAAGVRSEGSCKKMAKLGFKNLYNLEGGYDEWLEAK